MNNTVFLKLPKVWHDMTPSELKVFTVIYDMWLYMKSEEGFFFRSNRDLCKDCAMSDKTITKAINGLEDKGYITIHRDKVLYFKCNVKTDKFTMISKWSWKKLNKTQFKVYVAMRDMWNLRKNEDGYCCISYNDISKECDITRRMVIPTVRYLAFWNYVKVSKTDNENKPFYYTFNEQGGEKTTMQVVKKLR